ncbi:MAG: metalloregulator ArsR/SmtB family transcription factor [Myxococcota bacterium]
MSEVPEDPEEQLDRIFHALADRTRRQLLAQLLTTPGSVTELAAPFEMSLPAVSKHIKVLERAGLVVRTVDGRLHRCSLGAGPLQAVATWLDPYRVFWTDTLDALARFAEQDAEQGAPHDAEQDAEQDQDP